MAKKEARGWDSKKKRWKLGRGKPIGAKAAEALNRLEDPEELAKVRERMKAERLRALSLPRNQNSDESKKNKGANEEKRK